MAHRACDLRAGFGCRAFGRHRRRKARTRARARDGRASDGTRDTRRAFSNVIRRRASASSFLARRASNADGRRRARARDAGSRTRVRPLRARVARGDDTRFSPRARPRLRDRPAPPQPSRPNEKTSRAVPNRCLFPSSTDHRNDRKRDRDARRGSAVVTGFSVRDGGRGCAGYRGVEPPGQGQGRLRAEG